jgi:lipopolysaccharide exporter
MRSRLSANTLTLLLSNGGSTALAFVLSVLIGRALGQDGLGIYAAALAWVLPLTLLAEAGLSTLITREVAQTPADAGPYLHVTSRARLLLGGGLTGLLLAAAPLLSSDAAMIRGIQISAPLVLIAPFSGAFTAIFRAQRVMWPVAALNLGMLVTQVGLTAWVFAAGGGVLAVLAVNTITSAGQLAAAWAIWRGWFRRPAAHDPTRRPFKVSDMLRRAWPFALAGMLAALHMRIGLILLEQHSGAGETGYYAAASRFIEAGRLLPQAFFDALFPTLAALVSIPADFHRLFRRVTWPLAGFGLLAGAGGIALAHWLVTVTYGVAFAPAAVVLQIGLWSLLPGLLKGSRTLYWYALGHERFVNHITILTLALRVTLSLWLIPVYGAVGAALAHLAVEAASCALLWWPRAESGQARHFQR